MRMAVQTAPWSLTIASDLRLLALVRSFVEGVCQVAGCDDKTCQAVIVATDEAVNNVMRHAHLGHPEASIRIQCFLNCDSIEICLIDEGDPFDLSAVPYLDPGELRVGGRGVFLMRALMDELSCHPRGERGNTLRMVKHCRPAPLILKGA
jgi:anti-sigma regulatory factor (Ser/Thr protein kinase)